MTTAKPYESPVERPATTDTPFSYRGLWSSVIAAAGLLLIMGPHASIMGTMGLAILIVPGQALFLIVILMRRKRSKNALRLRLLRATIYGVTLTLLISHALLEKQVMRAQAGDIVEACHAYEKDHGYFPENLSELVPEYLPSLPETLGLISSRSYYYTPSKDGGPEHFVYHPELFLRTWYYFDTRQWRTFGT